MRWDVKSGHEPLRQKGLKVGDQPTHEGFEEVQL